MIGGCFCILLSVIMTFKSLIFFSIFVAFATLWQYCQITNGIFFFMIAQYYGTIVQDFKAYFSMLFKLPYVFMIGIFLTLLSVIMTFKSLFFFYFCCFCNSLAILPNYQWYIFLHDCSVLWYYCTRF